MFSIRRILASLWITVLGGFRTGITNTSVKWLSHRLLQAYPTLAQHGVAQHCFTVICEAESDSGNASKPRKYQYFLGIEMIKQWLLQKESHPPLLFSFAHRKTRLTLHIAVISYDIYPQPKFWTEHHGPDYISTRHQHRRQQFQLQQHNWELQQHLYIRREYANYAMAFSTRTRRQTSWCAH